MTTPDPDTGRAVAPYTPRGGAHSLFTCRDLSILYDGPAGTGKSRAALEKMDLFCRKYDRCRCALVRKTRHSLTESALVTYENKVLDHERDAAILDGAGRANRQSYDYPNGSTVVLAGMDRPERIMSTEFDLIVVCEATELSEDEGEKLSTRLRNGVGPYHQIVYECNPAAPSHWLKRAADDGRMTRIMSRHEDNPEVTAQYLSLLDNLTGHRHQRLRKGLWAAAEGAVYPEFDANKHVIDRFEIPPSWRRFRCIDFGYTNPFVCYDDQTDVLTPRGWVRFADLPDGLEVGTVNQETKCLEWQTPTAYINQPYIGPMVGCSSRRCGVNFCVTPNHRMVIENLRSGRWSMPRADQMPSGGGIPTAWGSSLEDDSDAMLEIPRLGRLEMAPVSRVAFARFLGLWLADGCLSWSKGGFRVRITQKARVPEVRAILEATGWRWSEFEGQNGIIDFSTNNLSLYVFLEKEGGRLPSHCKHLPEYVFGWGRASLEALLEGLLIGDGRLEARDSGGVITSTKALHTTSRHLADGVQAVAALLGQSTAIRTTKRKPGHGFANPSTGETYAVRFHASRRAAVDGMRLETVEYVGRVYCVTVPNGTLIVRRGGRPMVCGNCQWWAVDGDGRMFMYRELYKARTIVADHAVRIKELSEGERFELTIADHDAEDRATLARAGIDTMPAMKDVSPGLQAVSDRLRVAGDGKPRLFLFRDALVDRDQSLADAKKPCSTAEEFDGYVWKQSADGKPVKEEPVKVDDHGMDTMRYMTMHLDGGVTVAAGIVNHARPAPTIDPRPVEVVMDEMRSKDPNWGWDGYNGSGRITPQERYRR